MGKSEHRTPRRGGMGYGHGHGGMMAGEKDKRL